MMISRKIWQFTAIGIGFMVASGQALALIPGKPSLEPNTRDVSVDFPSSPNRSGPSSTAGGGVRGGICTDKNQVPLTAIIPSNKMVTTAESDPELLWYIPKTSAKSAEFVIVDQNGDYVYSKEFQIPQEPGLVRLSLPENTLKENQSHLWELAMVCDPNDRSADEYVYGSMQRFSLEASPTATEITPQRRQELLARLKTLQAGAANPDPTNLKEQAEIYAELQLWTETLNIVAQLRETNPNEWEELLKSVGIEAKAILEAPVVTNLTGEN